MKFSRLLEYHTVPEWAAYYIDYRLLKRLLKAYQSSMMAEVNDISESLLGNFDAIKELCIEIDMQSLRVNNFYLEKHASLTKELESVLEYIHDLKRVSTLNEKEAKLLLSMNERDDSQNRATSMQRAFSELHQRILWLERFCEINYIGLFKIISHFSSESLKESIKALEFCDWQGQLNRIKFKIYESIAEECLDGDLESAKKLLVEAKHFKAFDIGVICCCFGMLIIMIFCTGFMISLGNLEELIPSLCVFRLSLCLSISVILFSLLVFILESYSINWVYLFEITPSNKVSYVEILRLGVLLLTLWQILFTLHLSTTFYYPFIEKNIVSLMNVLIYSLIFFCPFNIFCRKARFDIINLFFQLIIAPFGNIRFKNYMFGSWLTSMVIPLKDFYTGMVFLLDSNSFSLNLSPEPSQLILILLSILPFIWRILQNVKRVLYKKSLFTRQVQNFLRYIISIGLIISAYLEAYTSSYWIGAFIIGSLMISALDIIQDWQLNIFDISETRIFPRKVYYYAAFSNLILRFAGVACLMPFEMFQNSYINTEILISIFALLELLRRTQWAVIRIEREKVDNKEKFRKVNLVPLLINN